MARMADLDGRGAHVAGREDIGTHHETTGGRGGAQHGAQAQMARAQHTVADVRRTATDSDGRPLPQVWVAGVVALAVVVGAPLVVRALRSRARSAGSVRFAR